MPTEPKKPLIVISYAHADEPERPAEGEVKWLSFVTGYLRPAIKHGAVDLWMDRLMSGGSDWEPDIEQKLRACDIFILLVSRHSLSSDYVVDKEIPIIRERQAKGEAVHFYPLILTPTPKAGLDLVRDKNLRPRDGKPLSDYPLNERYRHMSEAADEIAEIAARIGGRRQALARSSAVIASAIRAPRDGSIDQSAAFSAIANVKDRGTLEAWLRPQPRDVLATIAARAVLRVAPLCVYGDCRELAAATFRGVAAARAAGKYPARAKEIRAARAAAAIEAAIVAVQNSPPGDFFRDACDVARTAAAAAFAADSLARSADAIAAAATTADLDVDAAVTTINANAILDGYAEFAPNADAFIAECWSQIRGEAVIRGGVAAPADQPLWSDGMPHWAAKEWARRPTFLPKGEHWDVWIDWYDERLRGVPRGEAYDLVFATVPQAEWEKGPAAANAWIKARLPNAQ